MAVIFKDRKEYIMSRYYVDPKKDRIVRTDLYLVKLEKANGETVEVLEPKRLFPFSNPEEYITLVTEDKKEEAVIRKLSELVEESRRAIEECFEEIYMIPSITKVLYVEAKFGMLNFGMETDRGPIKFRIRNPHSDIKKLDDGRMLFRDSDDNRYEIPDITKLDKHSLHVLFPYI